MFQTQVEYLGHVVSEKGIQTDPKKVNVVKEQPKPEKVRDVRSFLELASYYRKFIPDFSTIAYPLTKLTQEDEYFVWGAEQQQAFEEFKQCLISAPILSYPKDEARYIVDSDANGIGVGTVLS